MKMLRFLAVVMSTWIAAARAIALPQSPPSSRYQLQARLDAETHTVHGVARIRWQNTSRKPAHDLVFHLYLNAFAHPDTVFFREGGNTLRGTSLDDPGSIQLDELSSTDAAHRLGTPQAMGPEGDDTQMRVSVSPPVPPGESVTLRVRFRSKLPSLVMRSGYVRDFHMVAQWFPKLARREPDGRWASFPYHGKGEFYADFAHYDMRLDVPAHYAVAATGERVTSRSDGLRRIDRYVADWVHDAAWVAWPHFRVQRFEARGVAVRILAPPGYRLAVERQRRMVAAGLRHFGKLFGAYPYPTLDVVIPPRGAEGAAGMEYPMLFVTSGPWTTWPDLRAPDPIHDGIVAHELAHQWFQGMLASHEAREPWLDEGLAQWATYELLRHRYGAAGSGWNALGVSIDAMAWMRHVFHRSKRAPSSLLPAHRYAYWSDVARAVYLRPALLLESVARRLGRRRLQRALGSYARAERFRHPSAEDLFAHLDAEYGNGFSTKVIVPLLKGESHRLDARLAKTGSILDGSPEGRVDGTEQAALLDARWLDDLPVPESPRQGPSRWWSRLLFWAQALFAWLGP